MQILYHFNVHNYSYICLYVQFSIAITVRFDKSSYRVDENVSTFSPELKLSRPSPCCATVYIELIELMSSTAATGELLNKKYTIPPILQLRITEIIADKNS